MLNNFRICIEFMDRPSVQISTKIFNIKRQWEHGTKRIINMLFLKIDNDRSNLWYGPFFNYIHFNIIIIIITIILHYVDELLV